jgi:hypothetical protein
LSLRARCEQQVAIPSASDLDEAINLHRAALSLCPHGHSGQLTSLNPLATSVNY